MMTIQTISEMTLDELKALITQTVDQRLSKKTLLERSDDRRSKQEVLESIRRNRWTPPPGAPSTLEMLREDRDR